MNEKTLASLRARPAGVAPADTLTPADRYRELFVDVQMNRVFADSKTFVDCAPLGEPEGILALYREQRGRPKFDLATFVQEHFEVPVVHANHYVSVAGQPLCDHIDGLWDVLSRHPNLHPPRSSLLPLPNCYVVPGGRFTELYYWDSYFTMLGLAESGRCDLLNCMASNFAYLIDTYGHIPNGNRTYYLSRSQPPVFALMVELFEARGVDKAVVWLPQLRKEYDYWMEGAVELRPGDAHRHCVRLDDGSLLNRYWDDRDTPREESHLEDVTTALRSTRPRAEVYRDLRAGAASGWDFSSRWCDDGKLQTIRTTAILPVDLNAFLYQLERQIAVLSQADGQHRQADVFRMRAGSRREAVNRWLWNDAIGSFLDYDWQRHTPRDALNAATSAPLYVGFASKEQAIRVAAALRSRLMEEGGLGATEMETGEQWDKPNGWAPLQWLAIHGLRRYGLNELAEEIAHRWLHTVGGLYERESKLVEKYVLAMPPGEAVGGGGGEYPLQDGFGWTNGVMRRLLHERPQHPVNDACAGSAA
ncbi:alpha,alpha-trehalase TreF [Dyella flagellata]|uniref:Cytoplasmic trehalase n=1 Tax=Dyella flagellata TaxID=1867833 RepID=A0ABQ5X667_9GAMM|nr:alpha,alpha-trehalase TreF [Dyella flagellata]GLQ86694.1 cytoplasmic trehalase [Dyella flagellata]